MSKKTRSKKLVVKGGFYSKEDMKTELGYGAPLCGRLLVYHAVVNASLSAATAHYKAGLTYLYMHSTRPRIEKIVKWAESKRLVRCRGNLSSEYAPYI